MAASAPKFDGKALRVEPRRACYCWGSIRELGRRAEAALVLNISRTGIMAQTHLALAPRSFVEVEMPGHKLGKAQIVWAERGKIGLRFLAPLY